MKKFDGINMIPLIDIMLVMLAITLTTATFTAAGRINVDLPKGGGKIEQSESPLIVTIDKDRNVYADDQPVTMDELGKKFDGLRPTSPVTLKVDSIAPFEAFVTVVDMLKARNLEKISILTERRA